VTHNKTEHGEGIWLDLFQSYTETGQPSSDKLHGCIISDFFL